MQINRIGGKFEILERGILIEICRDIQSADEVIEVCPPDYVADFETATTRPVKAEGFNTTGRGAETHFNTGDLWKLKQMYSLPQSRWLK